MLPKVLKKEIIFQCMLLKCHRKSLHVWRYSHRLRWHSGRGGEPMSWWRSIESQTPPLKSNTTIIMRVLRCSTWGNDPQPECRWTAGSCPDPCHHTGSHVTCTCSGRTTSSPRPGRVGSEKEERLRTNVAYHFRSHSLHVTTLWSELQQSSLNDRFQSGSRVRKMQIIFCCSL